MINHICPHCGKHLVIPDKYSGKTGTCNGCGGRILVPIDSVQVDNQVKCLPPSDINRWSYLETMEIDADKSFKQHKTRKPFKNTEKITIPLPPELILFTAWLLYGIYMIGAIIQIQNYLNNHGVGLYLIRSNVSFFYNDFILYGLPIIFMIGVFIDTIYKGLKLYQVIGWTLGSTFLAGLVFPVYLITRKNIERATKGEKFHITEPAGSIFTFVGFVGIMTLFRVNIQGRMNAPITLTDLIGFVFYVILGFGIVWRRLRRLRR